MVRIGHFSLVLATAVAALCCVPLRAQNTANSDPDTYGKVRQVPPAVEPAPFSIDQGPRKSALSVEFLSADEMTQPDRLLAANAESSIAEHAGLNGLELDQGKWDYQQVVCPALPNHLFLQYTRNNGVGDVTVFSASIPRGGEGRVRIVPILRRGYSLFSPAPINALTISAFNHIRAEEPETKNANWLGNGLCYAALAGGHPVVPSPDDGPELHKPVPALIAIMAVETKGDEVIHFADAAAHPRPMEWSMTFTRQGKLIKATHAPAPMIAEKLVPDTSATIKTQPVPQTPQD
jgi:hypothetical protein